MKGWKINIKPGLGQGLIVLALFFHLPPSPLAMAHKMFFKNINMENGLAHNTVYTIYQDKTGFMWFGTKGGLSRFDGHRFKNFQNDPQNPLSLGNNTVLSLFEDREELLWVGTHNGLYLFDPEKESFRPFDMVDQNGALVWGHILDIRPDLQGNIWIASSSAGMYRYRPESQDLTHYYHDDNTKGSLGSGSVSSLAIDKSGTVWVGILGGGVQRFIPANETFHPYDSPDQTLKKELILGIYDHGHELLIGTKNGGLKTLQKDTGIIKDLLVRDRENNTLFIRNMAKFNDHEIWICTELGVYLYDIVSKNYTHIFQSADDPYSLSDNAVYSVFRDKEGGIWLGTYFGGLNYLANHFTVFDKFYPINNKESIKGKRVRELKEDEEGNIWIGTEDAGLSKFDPKNKSFHNYTPGKTRNSISYHNIHGLLLSEGELWISSHSQGLKLDILDLESDAIRKIDQSHLQNPLFDSDIFSILEDRQHNKWFGTISGVYVLKHGENVFRFVQELGINFFHDILEDSGGTLWFGTTNNGLFALEPATGEVTHYTPAQGVPGRLPGQSVISIFEDSNKRLWIGTEGYGLALFDREKKLFKTTDVALGLPGNSIYKILEDDLGYLWFSTDKGLVRYNPETEGIEVYTKSNGLLSEQFNYKSGLKAKDGTLYFGSLNGFISFDPKIFSNSSFDPPIILTGLKIFNEEPVIGQKGSVLKKSITRTKAITLPFDRSTLSISFAALGFTASESYSYAYILEGLEKDWNRMKKNQEISYLNIPPGNYRFRVKTIDEKNVLSDQEASLLIEVFPPFYFSPLAYGFYFLLILTMLIWTITGYRKRVNHRHRKNMQELEDRKEKEIYHAKIEFFTNITHEIKTPLTLIKGPLEILLKDQENFGPAVRENLQIMERNSNRLISLSNQLLDFRKAEKKSFNLNFVKTDVSQLLEELHFRFKALAEQSRLEFNFHGTEKPFYADIDKEEVTKILSNLLSNALKNADQKVNIHLRVLELGSEHFMVSVCNDGKLIAEAHRKSIFEPFFQIENPLGEKPREGTGLGLPLARSLAEMHKGDLFLDSEFMPDMNCFTLQLPKSQENTYSLGEAFEPDTKLNPADQDNEPAVSNSGKSGILVVEDNMELQTFLHTHLKNDYHIFRASNGVQALSLLDEKSIDLIISDIMMPIMDGITLCREVKSKTAYSHIPIILLTAKNTLKSKIEGLETGADVYIEKPFSMEYLALQAKNLLAYRDQIRKSFANSPSVVSLSIAHTKADERFLSRVNDVLLRHLEDELFGVNELAEELNMSQSNLLRKIKGISKMTPNEYIRLMRLKKAAEMLNEGDLSIAEVCAKVGFNSPSYFSKCFQKQFGELPRNFQKA